MENFTLNDVYELLGLPSIYDQYLENGELPHWKCSGHEKIDLNLGKAEIHDGKTVITVSFEIEGL